jgi:hypothetical protein
MDQLEESGTKPAPQCRKKMEIAKHRFLGALSLRKGRDMNHPARTIAVVVLSLVVAIMLALRPSTGHSKGTTSAFTGRYQATVFVRPHTGDQATITGTGHAAQLGASSIALDDTYVYSTALPRLAGQGHGSITSRNGAQIEFLYLFRRIPTSSAVSGYYVIIDGSGAFAGARGSGVMRLSQVGATGKRMHLRISMSGTITYWR